jgi:hypothetical protein
MQKEKEEALAHYLIKPQTIFHEAGHATKSIEAKRKTKTSNRHTADGRKVVVIYPGSSKEEPDPSYPHKSRTICEDNLDLASTAYTRAITADTAAFPRSLASCLAILAM